MLSKYILNECMMGWEVHITSTLARGRSPHFAGRDGAFTANIPQEGTLGWNTTQVYLRVGPS